MSVTKQSSVNSQEIVAKIRAFELLSTPSNQTPLIQIQWDQKEQRLYLCHPAGIDQHSTLDQRDLISALAAKVFDNLRQLPKGLKLKWPVSQASFQWLSHLEKFNCIPQSVDPIAKQIALHCSDDKVKFFQAPPFCPLKKELVHDPVRNWINSYYVLYHQGEELTIKQSDFDEEELIFYTQGSVLNEYIRYHIVEKTVTLSFSYSEYSLAQASSLIRSGLLVNPGFKQLCIELAPPIPIQTLRSCIEIVPIQSFRLNERDNLVLIYSADQPSPLEERQQPVEKKLKSEPVEQKVKQEPK